MYSAYEDDTTFLLRDKRSIKELINIFATFSKYLGLKSSHEKCKIAGIEVMESLKVTVCGMKCFDLFNNTITFTWNPLFAQKRKAKWKNFLESVTKIQDVLKVWRMHCLASEGKIIVFKILAVSKIIFLSLISKIPTEIISKLERIKNKKRNMLWLKAWRPEKC